MAPSRYTQLESARRQFGARVDRFAPFFGQGDALADAAIEAMRGLTREQREPLVTRAIDGASDVPEAMRALVASVEQMPVWWDPELAQLGANVLTRSGFGGGVTLAFKCLITSYCSPAGNKPLVFSGRLEEDVQRRLQETGRFVQAVAQPEGLRPGTDAFKATLRVRLVHAQVRAFLSRSERWNAAAWGTPINQADMAATVLLFSYVFGQGLQQLGLNVSREEREGLIHLWRGVGFILGVEQELLCATWREGKILWDLVMSTQAPADEDSRRLARALLTDALRQAKTPADKRRAKFAMEVQLALTRELIGPELSRQLQLDDTPLRLGMPLLRRLVRTVDSGVRFTGVGDELARRAGESYWRTAVGTGLNAVEAVFGVPTQLARL